MCGIHGAELRNIQLEDVVVASGCGPIGLRYDMYIAAARFKNPRKLIALDWKVSVHITCIYLHVACIMCILLHVSHALHVA